MAGNSKLFIPGPITAVLGPQGSGKSFVAIKLALEYANKIEYDLTFNFSVNVRSLYEYSVLHGYTWLVSRILHGHIHCRPSNDLKLFMDRSKTLYILDEAGVFLQSRDFANIDKNFLRDLAQIRHDCKMLWWLAQYNDMVDRVLRDLTASVIQADCITRYSKKLGNYEIFIQRFFLFEARAYKIYLTKVADKSRGFPHFVRQRQLALRSWVGPLECSDSLLFDCYQSFGGKVEVGYVPTAYQNFISNFSSEVVPNEDNFNSFLLQTRLLIFLKIMRKSEPLKKVKRYFYEYIRD